MKVCYSVRCIVPLSFRTQSEDGMERYVTPGLQTLRVSELAVPSQLIEHTNDTSTFTLYIFNSATVYLTTRLLSLPIANNNNIIFLPI